MQKYIKTILASMIALSLNGCVLFHGYSPAFTQGNLITPEMIEEIHNGMPVSQVVSIMGSPVLIDTFSQTRYDYVYNSVIRGQVTQHERIIVSFSKGTVIGVTTE